MIIQARNLANGQFCLEPKEKEDRIAGMFLVGVEQIALYLEENSEKGLLRAAKNAIRLHTECPRQELLISGWE